MVSGAQLFDSFADDLLGEKNIRPLVIVAAAKMDDLLFEVLRRFLLPKIAKPKDPDEVLERDSGPLTTFSSRIKMCRRLGLIDETLYLSLEKLRALRNLCAHEIVFDGATSPARDHFAELRRQITHRDSYKLTWQRYFERRTLEGIEEWQCLLLTLCVLLQAIKDKVKPTFGSRRTLKIARK